MDAVQKQVNTLTHKVDALYQVVEQLNSKVSDALSECRLTSNSSAEGNLDLDGGRRYAPQSYSSFKSASEHKDVLADSDCLDTNRHGEKELTPEIQIQRLTAQLTAAYNRIAALEEQLLAQRVH